ncbi:MAG: DNA recombination/repair protein RecA [Candidatus Eremiobacteraeota bacterium]|nr:DNA recombination/repair protein RecA [Candidatus Eremiobacteraeota bacterium]
MSQIALKALLLSRWHGAAVHGQVAPLSGWLTGIDSVDQALAPVGIPRGRLTEIFGHFSSGKTTFAYALLANRLATGDIAAYIDPEASFFAPAARSAGIDLSRLIIARPRSAQALLRAADALVRGGACSVVVVDAGKSTILQTHHCARLVAQAEKTGTTLLVLSHGHSSALASFATVRLWARRLSPVWQPGADGGSRLLGYAIDMEIAKARTVAPGKLFSFAVFVPEVVGSWPVSAANTPPGDLESGSLRRPTALASAANQ